MQSAELMLHASYSYRAVSHRSRDCPSDREPHNSIGRARRTCTFTWVADERILYGWTACLWVAAKYRGHSDRIHADHLIACVVAANVLPHLLKAIVDQERPDRCMVHGPRGGFPVQAELGMPFRLAMPCMSAPLRQG